MSIQEHLNKIRNAIKGSEVRESIAKGIETAYDDASEKDNANMEVKIARGTNPNLNTRLNKMEETDRQTTAQLAQTEQEKADKTHVWNMENMGQDVKEAMSGGTVAVVGRDTILSENIVNNQLLPRHAEFLEVGKNKFDGNYQLNVAITTDNGVLNTMKIVKSAGSVAVIIPILQNSTYVLSLLDTYNRFRVGIMNDFPNVSSTPLNVDTPLYDYVNGGLKSTYTFTNTSLGKYLLVYVSNQNEKPRMQLEYGSTATPYENYHYKLKSQSPESIKDSMIEETVSTKIKNGETAYQSIKDLVVGVNKFDGLYDNGAIVTYETKPTVDLITSIDGKVAIVKVEKDTMYSVELFGLANRFKIAGYTGETKPVMPLNDLHLYIDDAISTVKKYTFNSEKHDWILVYVSNQNEKPNMNFIEGKINGTFIDYSMKKLVLTEKNIGFDIDQMGATNSKGYFFLDDLVGIYDKPIGLANVSSGQNFVLEQSKHTDIYAIFDDLVTRFPNRFSRKLLGNEATGLPIYEYTFTATTITSEGTIPPKRLKIPITSAIHGYEQASAWIVAQFFKDLCENHSSKPQLDFMWNNVDFSIVPVANPWGYDNNARKNSNGVDLNRNFPTSSWKLSGTPDDEYYGGASAGSELETQILTAWLDTHKDGEWYVDYHNIASGYPLVYHDNQNGATIGQSLFRTMTKKWKADYPNSDQSESVMFGYVKQFTGASIKEYAQENNSMKSLTFETPWQMPFGTAKYDKVTIETGVEAFGNLLVTICKSVR